MVYYYYPIQPPLFPICRNSAEAYTTTSQPFKLRKTIFKAMILYLILVLSYDIATHDIIPSDCNNLMYVFGRNESDRYQIRIRPNSLPAGQQQCKLVFVADNPWTDIVFTFTTCDNVGGKTAYCRDESLKYSYFTNQGAYFPDWDNTYTGCSLEVSAWVKCGHCKKLVLNWAKIVSRFEDVMQNSCRNKTSHT